MTFLLICRYPDIGDCRYFQSSVGVLRNAGDKSPYAGIQISATSALKMFADSQYADIAKKCRYC